MKKLFNLFAVALLCGAMWSCEYDDSDLWNKVEQIDERLSTLEAAVKTANEDLDALNRLVLAMKNSVTISNVVATENGYTIKFSNGTEAKISNGKDGINAPAISVKQDGSGVWCWALDGKIIEVDGKPLKAEGTDGAPGFTPKVRINEETKEWEIFDGQTWTSTGIVAEGKDGTPGQTGDSAFSGVDTESDANYVIFTLAADGQTLRIPKTAAFDLVIEGVAGVETFKFGAVKQYEVTAHGVAEWMLAKPDGWRADYADGRLTVTAPAAENTLAETRGLIAFHVTSATGACKIVKFGVEALPYELRVLTFEDEDYKGGPNLVGLNDWSSLIDEQQYGGPLLYPQGSDKQLYSWSDENNTFLESALPNAWGDYQYWGGGHAISNYVEMEMENGDYMHQLGVYYQDPVTGFGGHNGSKNFCVHYGYADNSGYGGTEEGLPYIRFSDGQARVVDHMWVMWSTYLANCIFNGNGLTDPLAPDGYVKLIAIGTDENGQEIEHRPEFFIAGEEGTITAWTKWDLSSLGKVTKIRFNVAGDSDNGYGFSQPAYFCYDDVAVRFE